MYFEKQGSFYKELSKWTYLNFNIQDSMLPLQSLFLCSEFLHLSAVGCMRVDTDEFLFRALDFLFFLINVINQILERTTTDGLKTKRSFSSL